MAIGLVACAFASVAAPRAEAAPDFRPIPCPADTFPEDADVDCGAIRVPENRDRPGGRKIKVAAALVHAPSPTPNTPPIVFVTGGPGFGAISGFALGAYFADAAFIENRDLILVDTRGTGISRPRLGCPEIDEADVASYAKSYAGSQYTRTMARGIRACRDRLEARGIDLSAYTNAEAAADLDALRRALGYETWNLNAASADGVLGLTYMRLFPDAIRSAILDSPISNTNEISLDFWLGMDELLRKAFAGCAANPACDEKYPEIGKRFYRFLRKRNRHPKIITLPRVPPDGVRIRVDGPEFFRFEGFLIFAGNLEAPESISALFDETWRATHGKLAQVYRQVFGTDPYTNDYNDFFAQGRTLSERCHDSQNFITRRDREEAAEEVPVLAPFFLDPGAEMPVGGVGCKIWGVGRAPKVQIRPVESAIPTLILTGEYDIAVPPLMSREIGDTLPNSFSYEIPAGAHLQLASFNFGAECSREIAGQFLDDPLTEPDSTCLGSIAPFDFTPPGP